MEALPPDLAVQALDYLVRLRGAQRTVANVDWAIFKGLYEARAKRPLFEQIVVESPTVTVQESEHRPGVLQRLEKASPRERWHLLINHLQGELAGVLGLDPSQLPDPRQGFFEMGMDSLMAVEFKNRLERSLGLSLPGTLAFDSPTIERLAEFWPETHSSGRSLMRRMMRLLTANSASKRKRYRASPRFRRRKLKCR